MWFHFLSHLLPVSEWFGNPSSTISLKRSSTLLHNLQNASCKFSSNSNQGKVFSHFLLYLPIPDLDGLEVEVEQCFLGGLGCTSISDSLPSSESLELETTEDLDALLKYEGVSIFMFCFFMLQFIYHSIWWCNCLVLFPSINISHGQHLHTSLPFYNLCVNC